MHVYTDGSVLDPKRSKHGGGGYFLVDADGKEFRGRTPAGGVCDSFTAELHGLRLALEHIATPGRGYAIPAKPELRFLTDSQSAIRHLAAGPWSQRTLLGQQVWAAMQAVARAHPGAHITVAWVPGHVDLEGNERADHEAKGAARDARGTSDRTPIGLNIAKGRLLAHARQQQLAPCALGGRVRR